MLAWDDNLFHDLNDTNYTALRFKHSHNLSIYISWSHRIWKLYLEHKSGRLQEIIRSDSNRHQAKGNNKRRSRFEYHRYSRYWTWFTYLEADYVLRSIENYDFYSWAATLPRRPSTLEQIRELSDIAQARGLDLRQTHSWRSDWGGNHSRTPREPSHWRYSWIKEWRQLVQMHTLGKWSLNGWNSINRRTEA